jgi:hypothetical protein
VIGFGANITPELLAKLDVGNDTIAKDVSSIKQAYGSVGSTQSDVTVMMVARTDSADAAKIWATPLKDCDNWVHCLLGDWRSAQGARGKCSQ